MNAGTSIVSLSGVRLEGGVEVDLGASAVSGLAPGARILILENVDAFVWTYDPTGLVLASEYTGRLSNEGERLALRGPLGETLLDFTYDPAWYSEMDGGGRSLVIIDADAAPSTWGLKESWQASASLGGSPGEPEPTEGGFGLQRPGDSNQDGALDLTDAVHVIDYLCRSGPPPAPGTRCVRMVGCPAVCGR